MEDKELREILQSFYKRIENERIGLVQHGRIPLPMKAIENEALAKIEAKIVEARIDEVERILEAGEGQTWDAQMANAVGEVAKRYRQLKKEKH